MACDQSISVYNVIIQPAYNELNDYFIQPTMIAIYIFYTLTLSIQVIFKFLSFNNNYVLFESAHTYNRYVESTD